MPPTVRRGTKRHTVVTSHIDELSGRPRTIQSSVDHGLRQADERDDGAVGRQAGVDVQQSTALGRRYRIRDRLDHLHVHANEHNQSPHSFRCSGGFTLGHGGHRPLQIVAKVS